MAAIEDFYSTPATELIEADTRPTFILDLGNAAAAHPGTLNPVYCNAALRLPPELLAVVLGGHQRIGDGSNENKSYLQFAQWAWNLRPLESAVLFNGFIWTSHTLKDRWNVISGTPMGVLSATISAHPATAPRANFVSPSGKGFSDGVIVSDGHHSGDTELSHDLGHAAWTELLPHTPHTKLFKDTDWSATPLGLLESWSIHLRQMTTLLLCDSRPGCLFWGPQKVIIYNEAYVPIAGKEKPLGAIFVDVWAREVVEAINHAFETSALIGHATTMEDTPFFIDRHGYLEETYFSWNMIPIHGEHGKIEGFWNAVFETTRQKLAERRIKTLISIASPPDMASFWDEVLKGFESNERDVPFVLVYSLGEFEGRSEEGSCPSIADFRFEAALGLSEEDMSISKDNNENVSLRFLPLVLEARSRSRTAVRFSAKDGGLPAGMFDGLRWRGFVEEPHSVVAISLKAGRIEYCLLLGLNPRKAYDSDYEQFVELLNRQLATSITSANLMDQARINHAKLSRQVVEGEARFKIMTETNPAGMFYLSPMGEVLYANDTWYNMTGHARNHKSEMSFMDFILEDDISMMVEEWHRITVLRQKRTVEVRVKKMTPKGRHAWILASGMPEQSEDGSLKSVMGCIADISLQKEAQEDAIERATLSEKLRALTELHRVEAEKARESQEKFMDVTSHEMRNPLSAILQSADGVVSSMGELASSDSQGLPSEIIQSTLEAAQTIVLCAQHQARIINDVLTLSKLDSAMVQITPVVVQPDAVVHATLNMFLRELASLNIDLDFHRDESYKDFDIDWIWLDPSRLTQVFINLMTNAIKFTKTQPLRRITVTLGASVEAPPYEKCVAINWFPSRTEEPNKDITLNSEWGSGEQVFIYVSVSDTGRGLTNDEQSRLFRKFAQANVRTHVEYGGSGLGLFISRELTELQGGEIGLKSESGNGSTFAFYVKGRRASAPLKVSKHQSEETNEKLNITTLNANETELGPVAKRKAGKFRNLNVLLVEDNLVNQRVLGKQLEKAGHSVALANHGQEALEYLQATSLWKGNKNAKGLDVVLMDLEMPVMDGLTAARHVREFEASGIIERHLPIIAVTANARKEQIETCLHAGMDDVMPKPFRVAELQAKMGNLLATQ